MSIYVLQGAEVRKTEQAFATALGLEGDSYEAMNSLYDASDQQLLSLIDPSAGLGTQAGGGGKAGC